MKKTQAGPTRQDIQKILRDFKVPHSNEDVQYQHFDELIDAEQAKFERSPKMLRLKQERDKAHQKATAHRERIMKRLRIVREKFLSHGLTPSVIKMVQNLVDEFHSS